MRTRFTHGQRVRLAGTEPLQGLEPGTIYVVQRVVVKETPRGGCTDYHVAVADTPGCLVKVLPVRNGHLILTEAEG
jgi:hypothetical protein